MFPYGRTYVCACISIWAEARATRVLTLAHHDTHQTLQTLTHAAHHLFSRMDADAQKAISGNDQGASKSNGMGQDDEDEFDEGEEEDEAGGSAEDPA